MNNQSLYNKLTLLPDNLKSEVEDFIDLLTTKVKTTPVKIKPQFGSAKGMFIMHPDFDEPLDDFTEYMQ